MALTYTEVMVELENCGTAQNRKVYCRHGVSAEMFGVSYAHLGKLRKKIEVDQDLALELWSSGNHDARILATMVADAERMDDETLEQWVKDLDNYVLTDAFSALAARTPLATKKMEKWTKSKQEWVGAAGWNILTQLATKGDVPDAACERYLETIETGIGKAKNRVRHSMNMALIAIGLRNPKLEKQAIAAAKHIGKVEVDHGETGCKTPEAIAYMAKAKARKKRS